MINTIKLCLLFCLGGYLSANAQQIASPKDYEKWTKLSLNAVSPKGDWIACTTHNTQGDTLMVRNTITSENLYFPKAFLPQFSPDGNYFGCSLRDSIILVNMLDGKQSRYSGSGQHNFTGDSRYFIYNHNGKLQLIPLDKKKNKTFSFERVSQYVFNSSKTILLMVQESDMSTGKGQKIVVFDVAQGIKPQVVDTAKKITGLQWNKNSSAMAYYKTINGELSLCVATKNRGKNYNVKQLSSKRLQQLIPGSAFMGSALRVGPQGNIVLFDARLPVVVKEKGTEEPVKIWNSTSKDLAPLNHKKEPSGIWLAWSVERDTIIPLETLNQPVAVPTRDFRHALVFGTEDYTPRFKYTDEYIDIYLLNLITGKKELLIEKQLYQSGQTVISPKGRFVTYFKNNSWWCHDLRSEKTTHLSSTIPYPLYREDYDLPGQPPAYTLGGWTDDERYIFLYDTYDIWQVEATTGKAKKITNGRPDKIRYRLYDDGLVFDNPAKIFGFTVQEVTLKNPLTVIKEDTHSLKESLVLWDKKNGLREMVPFGKRLNSIQKALDNQTYFYFDSDWKSPPRLCRVSPSQKPKVILQSNPSYLDYDWGTARLIDYKVNDKDLKAALYYPAGYDPEKNYPMVVNIYERLSSTIMKYVPATAASDNGISIAHLTANGYFVLCPDIAYRQNDIGQSAVDCVTAAVNAACSVEKGIDKKRMGITGHSFGGYQVCYLLGKSKLFRAAVAGAPVTDITSHYLTLNPFGMARMDTFDSYQFRIDAPYYSETFKKNSPVDAAPGITTPLLLWSSDSDPIVDYYQAQMLYNALWRMQKESTLLLYPDEEHSLMEEKNRQDLTEKVMQWLDYHLKKDSEKPQWLP